MFIPTWNKKSKKIIQTKIYFQTSSNTRTLTFFYFTIAG